MEWYWYLLGILALIFFFSIIGITAVRVGAMEDSRLDKIHEQHPIEESNNLSEQNVGIGW